jgi:hypothetical protein
MASLREDAVRVCEERAAACFWFGDKQQAEFWRGKGEFMRQDADRTEVRAFLRRQASALRKARLRA